MLVLYCILKNVIGPGRSHKLTKMLLCHSQDILKEIADSHQSADWLLQADQGAQGVGHQRRREAGAAAELCLCRAAALGLRCSRGGDHQVGADVQTSDCIMVHGWRGAAVWIIKDKLSMSTAWQRSCQGHGPV